MLKSIITMERYRNRIAKSVTEKDTEGLASLFKAFLKEQDDHVNIDAIPTDEIIALLTVWAMLSGIPFSMYKNIAQHLKN